MNAAKQTLKVDFVSDIACPWCAIGLASLGRALDHLGESVTVKMAVHPFELNPQMGPEGEDIVEYLGKKYGRTPEQIQESQAMIRERGESVGFTFGPRTRAYNTFDAHRLLHWAGMSGKQVELKAALMQAYHGEGKNPGDPAVLVEAAGSVGLDTAKAAAVLANGDYANEVRAEEEHFQSLGIHSVPAIIFNDRYLVSGGQPVEVFDEVIQKVLAEAQSDE
jgi:predicted DsbA family dithiol-disulfide isomerase